MSGIGAFNVFPLQASAEQDVVPVDEQGRDSRQRKRHTKSRAGCVPCKLSRVKVWSEFRIESGLFFYLWRAQPFLRLLLVISLELPG